MLTLLHSVFILRPDKWKIYTLSVSGLAQLTLNSLTQSANTNIHKGTNDKSSFY